MRWLITWWFGGGGGGGGSFPLTQLKSTDQKLFSHQALDSQPAGIVQRVLAFDGQHLKIQNCRRL